MATIIDPQAIRELSSIIEGINPFPNPNDFNLDTCRGFKKDATSRCGISSCTARERKQVAELLAEFRVMTNRVDTNSLYVKMETFITLTHCKRVHRDEALRIFYEWKAQRKTAASSSLPKTPSKSATPHVDSTESLSDLSSMASPSPAPDSPRYDEPVLDSYITEKMKGLKIDATAQNTQTKTDYSYFDEVEAQRENLKRLGVVVLPEKGKEQDNVGIYKTIQSTPSPRRMSGGILYILKHTKISGILKIGWSGTSAELRLKQPKNCYGIETSIIYETEGESFIGAFQAERIAHAILDHKRIQIFACPHCKRTHREWFLVSRQEACSVVELAERWLKLPAYAIQQGKYKLTPKGDSIHKIMFPFSISKMNVLIDKVGESDNNSGAFPDTTSAAAVRETRASNVLFADTERRAPRVCVDSSHIATPPRRYRLRETSPARGAGDRGVTHLIETEEVIERYEIRSRATSPDGDYIVVAEHANIVRKKVSITNLEYESAARDYAKSPSPDPRGKRGGGKLAVGVWEVHTA